MNLENADDGITWRIQAMGTRVLDAQRDGYYFYNQPVSELLGGGRALVRGREMGMYASYSYLGLIGHPRINVVRNDKTAGTNQRYKLIEIIDIAFFVCVEKEDIN